MDQTKVNQKAEVSVVLVETIVKAMVVEKVKIGDNINPMGEVINFQGQIIKVLNIMKIQQTSYLFY